MEEVKTKKNRDHFWMLGCLGSALLFPIFMMTPIAAMLLSPFKNSMTQKMDAQCVTRLKKIHQAMEAYQSDHDGIYPPSESWLDKSWRYGAKKDPQEEGESVFKCPEVSILRKNGYGYAMNSEFGGKNSSEIADTSRVLIFDSSDTTRNAHGGEELAPNPARHFNGKHNNGISMEGAIQNIAPGKGEK